jgi:O-antigen/teichoic acid export membrane protein
MQPPGLKLFVQRQFTRLTGRDLHLRELLQSGGSAFLLKIGSVGVMYLFYYLVAWFYGPAGNGLFGFCFTVLNLLMIAALFGLDTYLVRYFATMQAEQNWPGIRGLYWQALAFTAALSLGLGLILFGMVTWLSSFFSFIASYHQGLQLTAAALVPAAVLRLNAEALRGLKAVTLYSLLQNISIIGVALVVLLGIDRLTSQPLNILYALLAGEVLVMLWSFYLVHQRISLSRQAQARQFPSLSNSLATAWPYLLTSATFFLMNWTDKLMLGLLSSQAALGVYDVALKIANLGIIVIFAINTIAAPKFAELYNQGDLRKLETFTHQTTFLVVAFTLPILLGIYAFPAWILSIFGQAYTTGQASLLILVTGAFVNAASGSVIIILNMTGKQKLAHRILLVVGLLNISLNSTLIPLLGIQGAAIATTISTIAWNLAAAYAIFRYYGFWPFQFTKLFSV